MTWMLSTSLKKSGTEWVFPPVWLPDPIWWRNYLEAMDALPIPFYIYFINTFVITLAATLGTVITSSLAAFAFARLRFPLRHFMFLLVISTMMLPNAVTLIPRFLIFRYLGWLDTFLPLIVPYWLGGTAFSIFLLRQFFMGLPRELDEAARPTDLHQQHGKLYGGASPAHLPKYTQPACQLFDGDVGAPGLTGDRALF
jgi:ABC-type glycerol-3-phosphate transport system permease component